MKNFTINRSKIMQIAHQLKKLGFSFGDAQRKAWEIVKAKSRMVKNLVAVTFKKKDGTETTRIATLNPAFLPEPKNSKGRKSNPLKVNFWSITDNGFRSFLAQNFVSVRNIDTIKNLVSKQLAA